MKRLGKFSGKIYDESYDIDLIEECCLLISDEQAENEEFIRSQRVKNLLICAQCYGCPRSNRIAADLEV